MTHFRQFAAIDWSGAKGRQHKGIALAICDDSDGAPMLVAPAGRAWSRSGILEWIRSQAGLPMLIGLDFSFAPPLVTRGSYLPGEATPMDARGFWSYVDQQCSDEDLGAASFLECRRRQHFYFGAADGRKADFMHLRICEQRYNAQGGGKPSSVYDSIGAAQVAKASFAGMRVLHQLGDSLPVWPFDQRPDTGAAVIEIYTSIAARAAGFRKGRSKMRDGQALDAALAQIGCAPHEALEAYTDHATDVILSAAWLRANARREEFWHPPALSDEIAHTEGWTFGVV